MLKTNIFLAVLSAFIILVWFRHPEGPATLPTPSTEPGHWTAVIYTHGYSQCADLPASGYDTIYLVANNAGTYCASDRDATSSDYPLTPQRLAVITVNGVRRVCCIGTPFGSYVSLATHSSDLTYFSESDK